MIILSRSIAHAGTVPGIRDRCRIWPGSISHVSIQSKNRSRRASGPSRVSSSCSRSWINVRAVIRLPSDPGRMWTRHRASRSRRCRSRRSSTAGCRPVSRRDRPRHGRTIPIGHHLSVISSILSSVLMKRSFIFSRYSSSAFHSPRSMAS